MAFITAPDFKVRSIQWSLNRPSQINVSEWNGRRTVVSDPWHGKWRAAVEMAPVVGVANIGVMRSFLARCRGSVNTFRLYATEGRQNGNGGVTASAAAAVGAISMSITGWGTALLEGQFATVNGQLLQLTANQSGNSISFEPPLRAAVSIGATVATARPYALVYMANSATGWSVDNGQLYGVSFDVEEAIMETDGSTAEPTATPVNTVAPAITGTVKAGSTLTTTNGTWTGASSYTRQWRRSGGAINGATALTYVLTDNDVGATITVDVTAINSVGDRTATSNSVGPVAQRDLPANTVLPVVTGDLVPGRVLSSTTGTWTGSPTSYSYLWLRGSTPVGEGATYTIATGDIGSNMSVKVTGFNSAGSATVQSATVGPITDLALSLSFTSGSYASGGKFYALTSLPGYSFASSGATTAFDTDLTTDDFADDVAPINGLGYHCYETLTSHIIQSQDFGTSWIQSGGAVTINTLAAPNGTTTADLLTDSNLGTSGSCYVQQNATFTASGKKSMMVFVKAGTINWLQISAESYSITGLGAVAPSAYFDLTNGVVGDQNNGGVGSMYSAGNGWWLCVLVIDLDGTDLIGLMRIRQAAANGTANFVRDGTHTFYMWQAQTLTQSWIPASVHTPLLVSTTTEVSSWATKLALATSLPGDFIAWAVVNMPVIDGDMSVFTIGTNTSNLGRVRITTSANGSFGTTGFKVNDVVQEQPPSITQLLTGRLVLMLRYLGGAYSLAVKRADGSITISDASLPASLIPTNEVDIGAALAGTSLLNGRMEGFYQRDGSFNNAAITAILQAA